MTKKKRLLALAFLGAILLLTSQKVLHLFGSLFASLPSLTATAVVPSQGRAGSAVSFQGGVAEYRTVTIQPSGGQYKVAVPSAYATSGASEIVLDVPGGAVDAPTAIGIRLVGNSESEPVLQSYGLLEKYFLGGFEVVPATVQLKYPIQVTFPIGGLRNSADLPYHFRIDNPRGAYGFAFPTAYPYFGAGQTVSAQAILKDVVDMFPQLGTARVSVQDFNLPHVLAALAKALLNSDCLANPCRCGLFTVTEASRDEIVAGFCYLSEVKGQITYHDCPGRPTESWTMKEYKKGTVTVAPAAATVEKGKQITLLAAITDPEGKPFKNTRIVTWSSADPAVASVDPSTGVVTGKTPGSVRIIADAGCDVRSSALITVPGIAVRSVAVDPAAATMDVCAQKVFKAVVIDENGAVNNSLPVTWSSSDETVATPDPKTGIQTTVHALKAGTADITATVYGSSGKSAVTVNPVLRYVWESTDPAGDTGNVCTPEGSRVRTYDKADLVYARLEMTPTEITGIVRFSPRIPIADPLNGCVGDILILIDSDQNPATGCYWDGIGRDRAISIPGWCSGTLGATPAQFPYGFETFSYYSCDGYIYTIWGAGYGKVADWVSRTADTFTFRLPFSALNAEFRPMNFRVRFHHDLEPWCPLDQGADFIPDLSLPPAELKCPLPVPAPASVSKR